MLLIVIYALFSPSDYLATDGKHKMQVEVSEISPEKFQSA